MNWLSRLSSRTLSGQLELRSHKFNIGRPEFWGFLDEIELDPCGLVRLRGWASGEVTAGLAPEIALDSVALPVLQFYRIARADVRTESPTRLPYAGVVFEYLVPEQARDNTFSRVSIRLAGPNAIEFSGDFRFSKPHYASLLNSREILHREHIYGFGPPNPAVSPEIVPLANLLEGRILDFGCGSGALVHHLRSRGLDALGLELDNPVIRNAVPQTVRPFVTFYQGGFPSPFAEKSFDCLFCSEVLEHIPDVEAAITDIARLTARKVIVTVPDMSAIPIGFRHGLIPWHLLEATHLNFFTQTSLASLLDGHFSSVEFGRMGPCRVNDTSFHVSLVAQCVV
jgi:2-polyprenyl-3-methyl-5-hydroxy-6-metoxy-1,4-benzoquinol methylase